jgi:hypothetical protein
MLIDNPGMMTILVILRQLFRRFSVRKLLLLLAAKEGTDLTALNDLLLAQISFIRETPGGTFRLALRDDAAKAAFQHMGVPEFEAIVELGVPEETGDAPLLAKAEELRPKLAEYIDPARSGAVLGNEWIVVPGEGPFQLFRCMSRREDKTLEEFAEHWRTLHADLGRLTPGKAGYFQLHRDPEAQTAAAKAAGVAIDTVDGVAQLTFINAESIKLLGSNPGLAAATAADGALFVDRTKAMGNFAHVVVLAGPLS